jgi:hypothetical protein
MHRFQPSPRIAGLPTEWTLLNSVESHVHLKNRREELQSFFEAPESIFRPGFNVIIGQNSSGKTALLEALSLDFPLVPHRSVRTIPIEGGAPEQISTVVASVTLSSAEIMEFLFHSGGQTVELYLPAADLQVLLHAKT